MNIKPIQQHIDDEYGGSNAKFSKHIGKTNKQVCRYITMGCWWVNGAIVDIKYGVIEMGAQASLKAVSAAKGEYEHSKGNNLERMP